MKTDVGNTVETRRETTTKENMLPNRCCRKTILKRRHKESYRKRGERERERRRKLTDNRKECGKESRKRNPLKMDLRKLFCYLRERSGEQKSTLKREGKTNSLMRAVLVNWLLEIVKVMKLSHHSFFLCIHIMDRGLEEGESRDHLQLLGITSLFMASKFEEIQPPSLSYLCYLCEGLFSPTEIVEKEAHLLRLMDFRLVRVSPLSFLGFLSDSIREEDKRVSLMLSHLLMFHGGIARTDVFRTALFAVELAMRVTGTSSRSLSDGRLGGKEADFYLRKTRQVIQALDKHNLLGIRKLFAEESVFLSVI